MIQEAENNFGKDVVGKVRKQLAQERDHHHHHQHTSSPSMCAHASPASAPPVKAAGNHFHEHTAGSGGMSGGATESSRMLCSPAGRELEAFLTSTLSNTARDRRHQLAIGMLIEEMTVGTLVMTAKSSMVILGLFPRLPPAPRLPQPCSVPLPLSNSLLLSRSPALQPFFFLSPPLSRFVFRHLSSWLFRIECNMISLSLVGLNAFSGCLCLCVCVLVLCRCACMYVCSSACMRARSMPRLL
jgi:hypothetical protein